MNSTYSDRSPRYMIKVSADAIRRNVYNRNINTPAWVVVNAENPEQTLFVHGVIMFDAETITDIDKPLPDGYGHSIAYLITTRGVDVQLELGGEFVNLFDALESGAVKWSTWRDEYKKHGLDGCS